jgi:serralysin
MGEFMNKSKRMGLLFSILIASLNLNATTFYVAKTGSKSNPGTSAKPFLTINQAMQADLGPGDTVVVRSGIYSEKVIVRASGSKQGGYLTIKSEQYGGAKINASGVNAGIFIYDKSYVRVDGFELYGSDKGSGLLVAKSHHIQALNLIAHDNGNAGIYIGHSEFAVIDGAVAYRNARVGPASAIAIKYPENVTGDKSTPGFRLTIRNSIAYNNITKEGPTTDGCGFIFDDFNFVNFSGKPYKFPSLMENNLSFGNSGRGFQVVHTENATIRNNTAYHNNVGKSGGSWSGELSNLSSSNTKWINNIGVAKLNEGVAISFVDLKGHVGQNVVYRNNITFNGTVGAKSIGVTSGKSIPSGNGNKFGVDPKISDPATKDFTLHPNSPAVDAGTAAYGLPPDALESPDRTVRQVDMGAYEQ